MKKCQKASADHVSSEMIRKGGDIVFAKIMTTIERNLELGKIHKPWKHTNIVLLYNKEDNAKLEIYTPISPVCDLYKL